MTDKEKSIKESIMSGFESSVDAFIWDIDESNKDADSICEDFSMNIKSALYKFIHLMKPGIVTITESKKIKAKMKRK